MADTSALISASAAIDQVRIARVTTRSAIQRSLVSLAETRAQLVLLRQAAHYEPIARRPSLEGEAAAEAQRLLETLKEIQNRNA